ncbi:MAG TPA: carotenoid 1,2-hydratase [Caldimonas sp.]|nr:carotenoid 1,2-hydratase [Caldimonas sp.]
MTERGARRLDRDAATLRIGASALTWRDDGLCIEIDETTSPWPSRVRGTVRLRADTFHATLYPLDASGRHVWQPIAPCALVEVDLERPRSRWRGHGYLDANRGGAALEADFARWHWARARADDGSTTVLYDVQRRHGGALSMALAFDRDGRVASADAEAPPVCPLPRSAWRLDRATRSDTGRPARVVAALEDGPFYARSLVRASLQGSAVTAVHESLDLDRFASPWVQAMLPFRMPRRR